MLENKTKMKPGTRFVVYYVGGLFLVSVVVFINLLTSTSSEGRCIDYCTGLELNVIRYLAFWFFLFPPLYGLITLIRAYRKDRNNFLIKSKLFFKNPLVILLIFLARLNGLVSPAKGLRMPPIVVFSTD